MGGAVGDDQGQAAGHAHHRERGDEGGQLAVGDREPGDGAGGGADQQSDHEGEDAGQVQRGEGVGGDHGTERGDGADGQVDPGGDDHEGHAEGEDRDDGRLDPRC